MNWLALIAGAVAILWGLYVLRTGARELSAWGFKNVANSPIAGCAARVLGLVILLMGVFFIVCAFDGS